MIRIFLLLALVSVRVPGQSISQVAAQSQPSSNKQGVTAKYVNTPLAEALRDVAIRGRVKINFTASKIPAGMQVTQEFVNVAPQDAFKRLLEGTKLQIVEISAGVWAVAAAGEQKNVAQGVIAGVVTDAKTGKGIAGATVSTGNGSHGVVTTDFGNYRLTNIAAGVQSVTVRIVGYAKQVRAVTVGDGATVNADFKLEPSASVLDQVVVTGTVIASELRSVPNAITVITSKDIEQRGITRIDQLFRGDVPGLFVRNEGSNSPIDQIVMFSRGASTFPQGSNLSAATTPIKTYIDGVEMRDPSYLSQIDPASIERVEIISGPQASTIYGSNALNGVMQIFTKRGVAIRPQVTLALRSGWVENNFSSTLSPIHSHSAQVNGTEGKIAYNTGVSLDYISAWTPGKQTMRLSEYAGVRMQHGALTVDGTGRLGQTQNRSRGSAAQATIDKIAAGLVVYTETSSRLSPQTTSLKGYTFGTSVAYAPVPWWSHELGLGIDGSAYEQLTTGIGYLSPSDTNLIYSTSNDSRLSQRYTTTARLPLANNVEMTVAAGVDHWRTRSIQSFAFTPSLTGTLASPSVTRPKPGHNMGAYVQNQLGFFDAFFLTYGFRVERNPNYGDKAKVLPGRYGASYTQSLGAVTAKLRGSYGRSTRPPAVDLKNGVLATNSTNLTQFGPYYSVLPNQELGPEYQQGGEWGVELYAGNRGSLVVTRYNQKVDELIAGILGVDSVPSLLPDAVFDCGTPRDDGYCYATQAQNLNIGSIRNQGWELQGGVSVGPLSAHGTYSWTKSRMIGLSRGFQKKTVSGINAAKFAPGASFGYLPEHTWATSLTYSRSLTSIMFNVNGTGFLFRGNEDELSNSVSTGIRLLNTRPRTGVPTNYRPVAPGYVMMNLNASQRFSHRVEGTLQINNLTNFYQNDYSPRYAVIGRQSNLGVRVRW